MATPPIPASMGVYLLRRLLAARLALPPEAVPIVLGPFGKPLLAATATTLAAGLATAFFLG